jgi:hypothetical protein
VLLAKLQIGRDCGKTYKLDGSRFQSATRRSHAFVANVIDLASSRAATR